MAAASRLSRRHVGLTDENPSVGTLIVAGEGGGRRIIGRGVTAPGGRPHAERVALTEAGARARGATVYVTLEPCAHLGRTGPCAEALVEAGVARVVIGAQDPDPRVDGRGRAILEAAGIEVAVIRPAPSIVRSFEGFLARVGRNRPHVTLKMAVSADGFVGRTGEGQVAITGPIANRQSHILRAESDAIMIGVGTALVDDPSLTCRLPGLDHRSPIRIVIDPLLRLDLESRLVRSAGIVPTIIASHMEPNALPAQPYVAAGCRFLPLGAGAGALEALFALLPGLGVSSVLVEGGPILAQSLMDADLVDRLIVVLSPLDIGAPGVAAPPGILHVERLVPARRERFSADEWTEYERTDP